LGVLAWRSYQLSVRMERGANEVAVQYAGYAAEITARRVDNAVRSEFSQAWDEWQQVERRNPSPGITALQEWIMKHEWIVSAIYVPDIDPENSIYASEIQGDDARRATLLTREFYTATGTVRYTYDPVRLLARLAPTIAQQPLVNTTVMAAGVTQRADVALVHIATERGWAKLSDGFVFTSPLAPPLEAYGIRAIVRTVYAGSGWENHRVISLWLSFVALALTALGAYLAMRGLKKESETTKLRAALIANVSHELRTPLSMIRLGAETLQRGHKLKESERKDIENQILREVLHLSHLVENVLDVARIQHQQTKALALIPVHPRDLVTTLVTTYESWIRSKGFEVRLRVEDGIEEQLWDREAVSRALLNLIDNAIKYTSDEKADAKVIEVVVRQSPEEVIVEVCDHGIGIEPRDLSRIFDPYFRAQFSDTQTRRGAGLGLTLVQQIVQSHGGRVEVESTPGVGSTFRLLFPRVKQKPSAVARLVHAPEAF
ncbi:MAG: sensor histidine kinase, partial [Thermoanaerobaculia bacterium]